MKTIIPMKSDYQSVQESTPAKKVAPFNCQGSTKGRSHSGFFGDLPIIDLLQGNERLMGQFALKDEISRQVRKDRKVFILITDILCSSHGKLNEHSKSIIYYIKI
jgi:hypothetical protein